MFRITQGTREAETQVLLLEGRLVGPWAEELIRYCGEFLDRGLRLVLDFREISFVDRAGMAAVRQLMSRQVALAHCPWFLSDRLRRPD